MKTYCDFTGVYENKGDGTRVWLGDITGTTGYCSDEAADEIRRRLMEFGPEGVHHLDNGNYHYMSLFWLEKIREPFDLIVFDHHTDMQPPALIDVLSCGNWILKLIENKNIPLNKAYIVGPPRTDCERAQSFGSDSGWAERVCFIEQERADFLCDEESIKESILGNLSNSDLPVYISVDRDILSKDEIDTNWDQGDMSEATFSGLLEYIKWRRRVIGIDFCGEPDIY